MRQFLHWKTLFALMIMLVCVNGVWGQSTTLTKNIADFPAGVQWAKNEKHDLGDGFVIYTNSCHFTQDLRIYSGGFVESDAMPGDIENITVNAGYKTNILEVYGSNNRENWKLVGKAAVSSKYGNCSVNFGTNKYRCFKLVTQTSSQVRVKTISVTYKSSTPSKQQQTLSFGEKTAFEIIEGNAFTAPQLTGDYHTAVSYTSSDVNVATVEAKTGAVTIKGLGTTIITATAAADATYSSSSASYTLTVKAIPGNVDNIAEFLSKKGTKSEYVFNNPVVVVKQYSNDLWIKDNTGYLSIHGNIGQNYTQGDEIPAGFSGTYSEYNTVPQLGAAKGFQAATRHGLEVSPIEMKVSAITAADLNKYVIIKSIIVDEKAKKITDGVDNIAMYDKFKLGNAIPKDSHLYDVVAIVNYYKSLQLLPISFTKVETGKQDQTLSFPKHEYTAKLGVTFDAPQVTGNHTKVKYSSSNPSVAKVNTETGGVALVAPGKAVITATAEADVNYNAATAHYTLFVEASGEKLPYRQVGGHADLGKNFINEGISKDYASDDAKLKFERSGTQLTMQLAEAPATLSYFVRWNGSGIFGEFVVSTSVDGKVYKDLKVYDGDTFAKNKDFGEYIVLDENVRYIRWTYMKKMDGNVGIGSIFVTKKGDVTAYPIRVSAVKHATFFADEAVILPSGLIAHYATIENAKVKLTPVYQPGDVLPANTPVVLTGEAADYSLGKTIVQVKTNDKIKNHLRGALTDVAIAAQAGEKFYILANDAERGLGFYFQGKTSDGTSVSNLANKAYLVAKGEAATMKGFVFESEVTGIEGTATEKADEAVYTLSGVRVKADKSSLPKGLYIIGGKKVLVK